ncbi:MAG TPA: cellulase family glycosylhydrolase [Polyangia bacterium]|nr:cellulase family glycosylhydrolase [Polyangia bacterium]
MRDQSGRALTLRGANVKIPGVFDGLTNGAPPAESVPAFAATDVAELHGLGFNVVRLPINWSAIEPQPGQLEAAYLDAVAAAVDLFRGQNIYVLLDLHQDGWSKVICEDGAPAWATVPAPTGTVVGDCHIAGAALKAFDSFFSDTQMLQEQYLTMLQYVARRFAGDETVFGYEIMNEPLDTDVRIAAFNAKAAAAIRAVDDGHLVLFEPSATRNITNSSSLSSVPFPVAGGVYSVHVYSPSDTADATMTIGDSVVNAREEADAWSVPLVVTETAMDSQDQAGRDWLTAVMDALDQNRGSLAYWIWKDALSPQTGMNVQNEDGTWSPNAVVLPALSRPYAQAIGGDPLGTRWDGSVLTVQFHGRPDVAPVHAIFWNQGAPAVACDGKPTTAKEVDAGGSLYEVRCGGSGQHTLTFATTAAE